MSINVEFAMTIRIDFEMHTYITERRAFTNLT